MTDSGSKSVLVLGASGLIGHFVSVDLQRRGYRVVAVARRFTEAQRQNLGAAVREAALVGLDVAALTALLRDSGADIVVNCLGVLQDRTRGETQAVHEEFVGKLIEALRSADRPKLLVHISIPGGESEDRTDFSHSKRNADRSIAASGLHHAILRPGFVFAPAAFGGSAQMRALAALPIALPDFESGRPFSYVAVEDIVETIDVLVQRWRPEQSSQAAIWDVMHPDRTTVGEIVGMLRQWLGTRERRIVRLPKFMLDLGARVGDAVACLGWAPPIRTTALVELRRGVQGDPREWLTATGITPRALEDLLTARPASVQEKWFARLYLLKPVVLGSLVLFWCGSAVIVLAAAFAAAVDILTSHGFSKGAAQVITVAGSVMDFLVGAAIAFRRTSRFGLCAGIAVSLFYMVTAAILTPDLWIEPLGALVKTFPAIVLMLVALAMDDNR